jgi:hypothetical protein
MDGAAEHAAAGAVRSGAPAVGDGGGLDERERAAGRAGDHRDRAQRQQGTRGGEAEASPTGIRAADREQFVAGVDQVLLGVAGYVVLHRQFHLERLEKRGVGVFRNEQQEVIGLTLNGETFGDRDLLHLRRLVRKASELSPAESDPVDARRLGSEDSKALFHCLTSSTACVKLSGAA